jgi:hypothetical protein
MLEVVAKGEVQTAPGDLPTDVISARAAGREAVGVSWGSGTADALLAAGAACVCDAVGDLAREIVRRSLRLAKQRPVPGGVPASLRAGLRHLPELGRREVASPPGPLRNSRLPRRATFEDLDEVLVEMKLGSCSRGAQHGRGREPSRRPRPTSPGTRNGPGRVGRGLPGDDPPCEPLLSTPDSAIRRPVSPGAVLTRTQRTFQKKGLGLR